MRAVFLTLAALASCAAPTRTEPPPIPILREEVITPYRPEQVDLLWVVDSSPSMASERASLVDAFPGLLASLAEAGIDFHIAVTTTACDDPGLFVQGTVLTNETPAPMQAFRALVEAAGASPAGRCGIGAAAAALAEPNLSGANAGFYRDDAELHVIVVSDQNDASPDDLGSFVDRMNTIKADPELASFSAIMGPRGGCRTAADGLRYRSVINRVGGVEESICQPESFGHFFDALSDVFWGPSPFYLTYPPINGVVAVWVTQDDYTYVGVNADKTEDLAVAGQCQEACFLFTYDAQQNRVEMPEFEPEPTARVHVWYWMWP